MFIKITLGTVAALLVLIGGLTDCDCKNTLDPSEGTAAITFAPEHADGDTIGFSERVVSLHVRLEGLGAADSENWVRITHNDFVYKIDPFASTLDNADGSIINGWVSFDYKMTCLHGDNNFKLEVLTPDGTVVTTSNELKLTGSWDATDNPLHLRLSWDTDESDFDFHCITPNGSEVWYNVLNADGVSLDVDDVDGYGPENMTVVTPQTGDPGYTYFVRYFDNHGITTDTTVTVDVYVNEAKSVSHTQVFTPSQANGDNASNDWTVPGSPYIIQPTE